MANYLVSFTISSDRANYDDVYQSLIDVIKKEAEAIPWKETTSFLAFRSPKSTSNLMHSLYFKSDLYDSRDTLLVINTTRGEYSVKGAKYPTTLKTELGLTEV